MQYTINQLYEHLYSKVNDVYEVFKNFFTEDNVDIKYPSYKNMESLIKKKLVANKIILSADNDASYEISEELLKSIENQFSDYIAYIYVWWKEVTITNEYNKSIKIQDLYAKVTVQLDGKIPYECRGFQLNRATYTKLQFASNYMHSHIHDIPKDNFSNFMNPCLGTGPIINTISTLKTEYDEIIWMLFCQELSMYVTVESIKGVPYHKLEHIGIINYDNFYTDYSFEVASYQRFIDFFGKQVLEDFIKYYLKRNSIKFSYVNKEFICGLQYSAFMLDISNAFIEFYNNSESLRKQYTVASLFLNKILQYVVIKDNKIYKSKVLNSYFIDCSCYKHKHVLDFKGKSIYTTIIDDTNTSINNDMSIILSHNIAMGILNNILNTLNFRYKNEYNKITETRTSSSREKIYYL